MCDVSEKTESSSHNIENGLDDTSLDSVEEERVYPKNFMNLFVVF